MPLYRQKGSSCWWISLHHPDHPRIRRSAQTDDRQEAQRIHDELKAELWKLPAIKGRTWGAGGSPVGLTARPQPV